ncbi:Uncharacterised protein [Staphylococcus gallinarum]|uniref:Uncharacterized protein n=1 Tax=Staphylococcus gallinarum TaxID=1293 RepID=A0A380FLB7_STAGA|nr:Uncharacterised protein [Staphylococcus gallinarum]
MARKQVSRKRKVKKNIENGGSTHPFQHSIIQS